MPASSLGVSILEVSIRTTPPTLWITAVRSGQVRFVGEEVPGGGAAGSSPQANALVGNDEAGCGEGVELPAELGRAAVEPLAHFPPAQGDGPPAGNIRGRGGLADEPHHEADAFQPDELDELGVAKRLEGGSAAARHGRRLVVQPVSHRQTR